MTASDAGNSVGACHCKMCRQWGGGPFMEVSCGSDVSIDGEEFVSIYDSSAWAERGFCSKCGTHLFYRLKDSRQHMIPVGLLDDDERLVFESQVFIDSKPGFYEFSNKTQDMTGAELFAKYAPPD
jgi:hypothetical protein